jgi:DNA-binding NarL/FixJ family response regulator
MPFYHPHHFEAEEVGVLHTATTRQKRMCPVSVLLVDANRNFLRILTSLLQEYYHHELLIVGTALSNEEALHQVQLLKPRIMLLGLDQHSLASLQLIHQVRAIAPDIDVVVLGSLDIDSYRQAATEAGATAFVAKVALNSELLPTIWRITDQTMPDHSD